MTKTSENLYNPLKPSENPPLGDHLRGRFPSQRLSVLLPLFICPLNFLQLIATHEWRRKFVTKIHADLVFWRYLGFEVFQNVWHFKKENPSVSWNATLSCPFIAANDANLYLVPISFWMLTMPWIFILSRFLGVYLVL